MTTVNMSYAANIAATTITQNQKEINSAMTRLATGSRINSASDDAGAFGAYTLSKSQGIANRAASSSINMGLAYLNTLDQGAQAIENIFMRMKTLAVQAANSGMSASDRYGLDAEFGALGREWIRTVAETKFNDVSVMHGTDLTIGFGGTDNIVVVADDYRINANIAAGVGIATGATTAGVTASGGGATAGAMGFGVTDIAVDVTNAPSVPATSRENIQSAATAILSSAKISNWIEGIAESRAKLGGYTNALMAVGDNMSDAAVSNENAASLQGGTNYASETARLSAHQIIAQAATAILAQANAQSATVLSLLK
jgi:flagellin